MQQVPTSLYGRDPTLHIDVFFNSADNVRACPPTVKQVLVKNFSRLLRQPLQIDRSPSQERGESVVAVSKKAKKV